MITQKQMVDIPSTTRVKEMSIEMLFFPKIGLRPKSRGGFYLGSIWYYLKKTIFFVI